MIYLSFLRIYFECCIYFTANWNGLARSVIQINSCYVTSINKGYVLCYIDICVRSFTVISTFVYTQTELLHYSKLELFIYFSLGRSLQFRFARYWCEGNCSLHLDSTIVQLIYLGLFIYEITLFFLDFRPLSPFSHLCPPLLWSHTFHK